MFWISVQQTVYFLHNYFQVHRLLAKAIFSQDSQALGKTREMRRVFGDMHNHVNIDALWIVNP
jgi:hypothetical protein